MIDTHHTARACPACLAPLTRTTSVGCDRAPTPGDLTICAQCSSVLVFADAMELQVAPQEVVERYGTEIAAVMELVPFYTTTSPRSRS